MNIIIINTQGDYWENSTEFLKELYASDLNYPVMLDTRCEAISLTSSGILKEINQYLETSGRSRDTVFLKTPNDQENHSGLINTYEPKSIVYMVMCRRYWVDYPLTPDISAKRFGHFVGRPTTPRIKLFYDIEKLGIKNYFLLSKLKDTSPGYLSGYWNFSKYHYDNLSCWFDQLQEQKNFIDWTNTDFCVDSIDNLTLRDQYDTTKTARLNLVQQANQYNIDIVFETFTVGDTFMPTEKLIRSLIAEKPFILYGSKHFLQNLKKLGFQTFDSIWNEEYDKFQLKKRYDLILKEIVKLSTLGQLEFEQIMEKTKKITSHNKQILRQINLNHYGSEDDWINNSASNTLS